REAEARPAAHKAGHHDRRHGREQFGSEESEHGQPAAKDARHDLAGRVKSCNHIFTEMKFISLDSAWPESRTLPPCPPPGRQLPVLPTAGRSRGSATRSASCARRKASRSTNWPNGSAARSAM